MMIPHKHQKTVLVSLAILILGMGTTIYRIYFKPLSAEYIEISSPKTSVDSLEKWTVHINGAVAQPGVYQVPQATRIVDLIRLAGGATKIANLDAINLALQVADGQKITIPSLTNPQQETSRININTASVSALVKIPGVGPSTAKQIVHRRQTIGPFNSIHDLTTIRGIGTKKLNKMRPYINCN